MTSSEHSSSPTCEIWHLGQAGLPGAFLGYGTLVSDQVVLLHPSIQPHVRRSRSGRARVRISGGPSIEVLDGDLVAGNIGRLRALRAVNLDGPSRAQRHDLPWPERGKPSTMDAFASALAQEADGDPAGPPPDPPAEAGAPGPARPDNTQLRPPWCWLFPNCAGCH
jgi:hypothetical protein